MQSIWENSKTFEGRCALLLAFLEKHKFNSMQKFEPIWELKFYFASNIFWNIGHLISSETTLWNWIIEILIWKMLEFPNWFNILWRVYFWSHSPSKSLNALCIFQYIIAKFLKNYFKNKMKKEKIVTNSCGKQMKFKKRNTIRWWR